MEIPRTLKLSYVAYKAVRLSSCQTIELSDYRAVRQAIGFLLYHDIVYSVIFFFFNLDGIVFEFTTKAEHSLVTVI